jgi:hypothetical protein
MTIPLTPADLAWTPERAMSPEILRAFHGRKISQGERLAAIRFRDIGHAAAWAEATDMVERSVVRTPNPDMALNVTVVLHLDITP